MNYRVGQVVTDLGLIDIELGITLPAPILLGQQEVWQMSCVR